MVHALFPFRNLTGGLLLALAGTLFLPTNLGGQTTPASSGRASGAQLPAEVQAQLSKFEGAIKVARAAGDAKAEAISLTEISALYYHTSDYRRTVEFATQALALYRRLGDIVNEAAELNNIGLVYSKLGEEEKALEYFNQALPVLRRAGNFGRVAGTLNNIGGVYSDLGEQQQALEYYNQALPLYRQAGDRGGEARALNNIGNMYSNLGEKQKALEYYNQALPIRRGIGDRDGEATTLNNIGLAYNDLGGKQKALEYYNQALPIQRQVGDRDGEARTLANIGRVYDDLGEKQKALEYLKQALLLTTEVDDPLNEAWVSRLLMLAQRPAQPAVAIFFGKQAVNLLQRVRGNIQGLDKELQKSFFLSINDCYHDLADLLITQGRLPEAEQVLDLLKEQEYSGYVRGETTGTLGSLTLTPTEKGAEEDYHKSTEQLVALGEQWAQLKRVGSRTAEQEKQYQQIADRLDAASKGLNDYYNRLYVLFGNDSSANKQIADVKGDVSLLKQQISKSPHTVALYTLAGKDRTSVIVITLTTAVARDYPIPEDELNKKVAAFQLVLRDRARDPRPPAQELYKILIGPVKADLDQAGVETLVWSLDGVLRYVPMAALFDGKQYLVEKYSDDYSGEHRKPVGETRREQSERGGDGDFAQV
jgi:tetratricopeptide (TPR) repeat protein